MQYKCEFCQDTGSMTPDTDLYDCSHCDATDGRIALDQWLAAQYKKGGMARTESLAAWYIHQRALAMAPKQEAPAAERAAFIAEFQLNGTMLNSDDAGGFSNPWVAAHWEGWQRRSRFAAPAAANGALTDERAAFESDTLDLYPSAKFNRFPSGTYTDSSIETQWGAWQRRSKFAAAGPDAALVNVLVQCCNVIEATQNQCVEITPCDILDIAKIKEILALSGAKGN